MGNRRVLKLTIKILVIIFWFVMMTVLVKRNYFLRTRKEPAGISQVSKSETMDEWMGIYFNREKIGYSHWMMVPDKDKNIYLIYEQTFIRFLAAGQKTEIRIKNSIITDSSFKLKEFVSHFFSSPSKLKIEGALVDKTLNVKISSSGKTISEISYPLDDIPSFSGNLNQIIKKEGLITGKQYVYPYYDPFALSYKNIKIIVGEKEKIKIYGQYEMAYKIKEDYDGIIVYSWLKEDGTRLREESPMGFIFQRERQDEALSFLEQKNHIDLIKSTKVGIKEIIKNPRETKYLKVKLSGINLQDFPVLNQGKQSRDGDIVEINSNRIIDIEEKNSGDFLAPGIFIQSDSPLIKKKAMEIIKNEKNPLKQSELICNWLNKNIKKKPTVNIPDALTILNARRGDCNEHAVLFAALARAVSIPAKICIGLVYSEDGFYYHAWNEVFASGRWISLDSIFNQIPADAAHIKLIEGDMEQQMAILKIIGQVKIEVLEYR